MDELLAKRAALVAARSNETMRVIFSEGGTRREVEYRSIAEIERAIAAIDRDIAAASGRRVKTFYPRFTNGFE